MLESEIADWLRAHPYTFYSEPENTQSTEHIVHIRFQREPDVVRWGLLFGDVVHHMRGTLDHLVYQLAIRESRQDPPPDWKSLTFPIAANEDSWNSQAGRISGLSEPMRTAIQGVQPYKLHPPHLAKADFIYILRELDDATKHREVPPVTRGNVEFVAGFPGTDVDVAATFTPWFSRLENEAPVMTVTTAIPVIQRVEPDSGEISIGFQPPPGTPPIILGQVFQRVSHVLAGFQTQFFPESL